ncbi:MAG: Hpt domain-containing protein [Porticoccaceae bacterium]
MMEPENAHNAQVFEWLGEEVEISLARAHHALARFADDAEDKLALWECQEQVHQVRGCLAIAQAAALLPLLDEIEALIEVMRAAPGVNVGERCDSLAQALNKVSACLHPAMVGSGRPLALLPILNDLRALRGERLYALDQGFHFQVPAVATVPPAMDAAALQAQVRKLRGSFQSALLSLLKGSDREVAIRTLEKVSVRLHELTQGTAREHLWLVAAAFMEGLFCHSIPLGPATRHLLRELDRELAAMHGDPVAVLGQPLPDLFASLLYYVAESAAGTPRIRAAATFFAPQSPVEKEEGAAAARVHDIQVIASLSACLLDEVEQIKDAVVRHCIDAGDEDALPAARQACYRIASALALAGKVELSEKVSLLEKRLHEPVNADAVDVAEIVVAVESALGAWRVATTLDRADPELPEQLRIEVNKAWRELLAEVRRGLALVKNILVEFFQAGANREVLTGVDESLHQLSGALRVVYLDAPAERLDQCRRAIVQHLMMEGAAPDPAACEELAEWVVGVEQYLDAVVHGAVREDIDTPDSGHDRPAADAAARQAVHRVAPPAPKQVEAMPAVAVDPEIREIFVEEARDVLVAFAESFPRWRANPLDLDALTETRRAFHTLKGSGRMVAANAIGELAWSLENLLNGVIERRIAADEPVFAVTAAAIALIPDLVTAYAQGADSCDPAREAQLRDVADRLVGGETLAFSGEMPASRDDGIDPALLEIFISEARTHLEVLADFVASQRETAPFYTVPSTRLQAAMHTLKGSANIADVELVKRLVMPLERFIKDLLNFQIKVDADVVDLLQDCHDMIARTIGDLENTAIAETDEHQLLLARIAELRELHVAPVLGQEEIHLPVDPSFLNLLMADGIQQVLEAETTIDGWQASGAIAAHQLAAMISELHELQAGAARAGFPTMAELCAHLAGAYGRFSGAEGILAPEGAEALLAAHDCLLNMADAVAANQSLPAVATGVVEAITRLVLQPVAGVDDAAPDALPVWEKEHVYLTDDADIDVVTLFLAEAEELLESIEQSLQRWAQAPAESGPGDAIKRDLHTFKGGAYTAGLALLGEISHDFESLVIASEAAIGKGDRRRLPLLMHWHDRLSTALESAGEALAARLAQPGVAPAAPQTETAPAPEPAWKTAEILPFTGAYKGLYPQNPGTASDGRQATAEQVRIGAGTLDMLVNLAGESSISRSQVEQNINEFIFSLDEMETTIRRMQDQVRRLAIETDAQVMFRREQLEALESVEGFDPLEMDRYSQLQQLSRGLLESASDLQDLRDTLLDKSRDAESLLLQQARINTDLQEGLMRTRMVSFSRVVPRLRRVVRQVEQGLGKQVQLAFGNLEGELDRSVLERILSPLEHMIRNAVDHGIESPQQRVAQGKAAEGTISLSFSREGGDVLIRLADDGRGLDIDAIRTHAIAMGLLGAHGEYSDNDIAQCIFHPGFSTSSEVTQVSGRGVGMDVVKSEVQQLGGTISMSTRRGAGTEFQVRLPFTVSVNRALMIELGEDSYALALNTITGVTRLHRDDLMRYYQEPQRRLEYGGASYEVRHLGSLLATDISINLDTAQAMLPVVLLKLEDRHYAVQVDTLLGSREIVVKTIGAQFSRVPGLSGATVLGDGRVVVILDLQGLLRRHADAAVVLDLAAQAQDVAADDTYVQTIMVVDDSVTVRKVTSRFLEREGFRVITAKDGVDAMRALQDVTPDLMLLDIEMPRMDGFEVARLVRSTQRLRDLPIIMITSRTGDKHRERALAMGVNSYFGKPYQEDVLIAEVQELLGRAGKAEVAHETGRRSR